MDNKNKKSEKKKVALDIWSYLLSFGVLGIFLGSSHTFSGGVWMSRLDNFQNKCPCFYSTGHANFSLEVI